ncbi:MAG: hypothetical protein JKY54_04275 [Flavobacteriales bacterium]|nr:hypothetical protein [Flavobacteriales bacterium]
MNKIDKDKLLHFFWSSILLVLLFLLFGSFYGCVSLLIIAALKEILWDGLLKKGTPQFLDFIFGSLPVVVYLLLNMLQ